MPRVLASDHHQDIRVVADVLGGDDYSRCGATTKVATSKCRVMSDNFWVKPTLSIVETTKIGATI